LLGIVAGLVGMSVGMLFSVGYRFTVQPLFFWFYLGIIDGRYQVHAKKRKAFKLSGAKLYALTAVCIGLIIALGFMWVRSISHYKAEIYYHKGLANFNAGYPAKSIRIFQQALALNRSKPEIYYKKGAAEVKLKRWSQALKTYRRLQEIHPDFFHVNYNLSLCYLNLGDIKNAIVSGIRQIARFPAFRDPYYVLGKAYYRDDNFDEAQKFFVKYLELNPESISALNYLGSIYASRSMWAMSLSQFEKIIEKYPQNLHVLLNISKVYANMGDLEGSCDYLSRIIGVKDSSDFVKVYLANIESVIQVIVDKMGSKPLTRDCAAILEHFETIEP
jgi:tetratricopeptide (TPR) repeat protein